MGLARDRHLRAVARHHAERERQLLAIDLELDAEVVAPRRRRGVGAVAAGTLALLAAAVAEVVADLDGHAALRRDDLAVAVAMTALEAAQLDVEHRALDARTRRDNRPAAPAAE